PTAMAASRSDPAVGTGGGATAAGWFAGSPVAAASGTPGSTNPAPGGPWPIVRPALTTSASAANATATATPPTTAHVQWRGPRLPGARVTSAGDPVSVPGLAGDC